MKVNTNDYWGLCNICMKIAGDKWQYVFHELNQYDNKNITPCKVWRTLCIIRKA